MNRQFTLLLMAGFASILGSDAFYQPKPCDDMPTVNPDTIDELQEALVDDTPRRVVLNKIFDFTDVEGYTTVEGCYHLTCPAICIIKGQQKLNVNNQCAGLTATQVTYSTEGPLGIYVGSNKIIVGNNGGLKGRGLRLYKSSNVEIRNMNITEINPHVIWGGDAIDLINVTNILIDNVFIKSIGRQMIVSHYGANTGVTISNSVFDGYSEYSANCRGNHYWLWLFIGQGDRITLQNNVVYGTAGRGPKLQANSNSKTLLHIIQNTFYDVVDSGLLDLSETQSSVLMEGNVFVNVARTVNRNLGHVFMPLNATEASTCVNFLGRECLPNVVVNSGGEPVESSDQVMVDFELVRDSVANPVDMKANMNKQAHIPDYVWEYIP